MIRIENLIRVHEDKIALNRIKFGLSLSDFYQTDPKSFTDWFGNIFRNG